MTILQIHDAEQSSAFFSQPHKLLVVRYEPIQEAGRGWRHGWDLLFYASQRDQLFVVLDYQRYPYLVPPLSLRPEPGLQQIDSIPFPLSVTAERLIPGLWEYATTVHHLRRYQLARENVRPGSVLDCACGVGYGIQMMLHEQAVTRAVGVDLSEFALDFSRRLVKDPRARFSRELPAERFDNITCFETLEHVPDPYAFMASLVERLAPGGRFFLSVPTERWGGNHLNAFHVSNWNVRRLVRFLTGFFGKITLRYQRVFFATTDTFSASEIRGDSWGPDQDEYLIAILEEPRVAPRPRTVIRQNGPLCNALWATPLPERVKQRDPSRNVLVVTEHNQAFIDNPHADLVLTPAWPGPIDVDLPAAATRRQWAETAESCLAGIAAKEVMPGPRLYLSAGDLNLGVQVKAGARTPLIACHPVATAANPAWWHAFWQELLRRLRTGHSVVLLGEQDVVPCEIEGVQSLVGQKAPLLALAGLLSKADLFIGPASSDLAHLAAAMGTRCVMLGSGGGICDVAPGSRFLDADISCQASAAGAAAPASAVEFALGLIGRAMRDPPATSSGPPASAPAPPPSRCPVCGGASFVEGAVLWPALIQEWGLTPAEVRLIDRQQGLCCAACHSNLRSMTLAAALLREYGPGQTLAEFVRSSEVAHGARLLEINQAGTLTPWLSLFRHYTFVQYPDTDMQNLKIADESFDIVVHSDTLEHVPDPVRGLRECRRVLRPGGKLLFTIPIVPSRLTRRRAGLPPSYHGNHANSQEYMVCSEYGADFFIDLVAAGFTRIHLHTLADLSSFGIVGTKDPSIPRTA